MDKMVPNMCSSARITGNKTNHSLCATAATDLFQADVPQKLIQERTGHKSVRALWVYQCTTEDQQKAYSEVLASTKQSFLQVKDSHNYQSHVQSLHQQQPVFNIHGCTVYISMAPPQLQPLHPPPPPTAAPLDIALEETELYES